MPDGFVAVQWLMADGFVVSQLGIPMRLAMCDDECMLPFFFSDCLILIGAYLIASRPVWIVRDHSL